MTIPFKELEKHVDKVFGDNIDQKLKERIIKQMNSGVCVEEDCSRPRANGSKRCQECTDYWRKWGKNK